MSTRLLYHACGIRGYTLAKTELSSGMMLFFLETQPQHCRCAACGSRGVIRRGSQDPLVPQCPLWHPSDLDWGRSAARGMPQLQVVRQIKIGFAEPRRSYTKALAQHMTIKDIADHLSLGWTR